MLWRRLGGAVDEGRDVMGEPIVHIVGLPGTGKTFVGEQLASILGWPSYSIDEERLPLLESWRWWPQDDREAWASLAKKVGTGSCVVETSGHGRFGEFIDGRPMFTVVCRADREVRHQRLAERVATGYRFARNNPRYIERLMRPDDDPSGDLYWDGSQSLSELGEIVAAWLEDQAWLR